MATYDELMAKMRARVMPAIPSAQQKVKDPNMLPGLKIRVNCKCPECDHKFVAIVVVQQIGILFLTPNYDKKGRELLT